MKGYLPLTETPAKCDRNVPPVTRGILVAADKIGPIETLWLGGPQNDTEFLRNSLVARGADGANLLRLVDGDATFQGLTRAASDLLSKTNCGDSVILHFSSFAFGPDTISASLGENGPFSTDPKTVSLAALGTHDGMRLAPEDWLIAAGPFVVLNQSEPGKGDVFTAEALSELVTLLRNQGADVSVSLDVSSAQAFRLEDWQERVNAPQTWRETFVPPKSTTAPAPNSPTFLSPSAGALSVLYGSEVNNPGGERKYPRGSPHPGGIGDEGTDVDLARDGRSPRRHNGGHRQRPDGEFAPRR